VKRIVLDNSVVMAWAFEDEADAYCERVLNALREFQALAPPIWPLEVANALWVAERRKRIKRADALRFVRLLQDLPIEVVDSPRGRDVEKLYLLAADHGLSAYDASYLALALSEALPLATRDAGLRKALKKAGGRLFG